MSLLDVFDISGSGLSAQTLRLNTTSSNLANVNSVSSSVQETYRARHPVFSAVMEGVTGQGAAVGVRVLGIVESDAPLRVEYSPDHPMANADGYITLPNVNPVEEMANMISASRSYQTNLEAINVSKQLLLRTLSMGGQ